MTTVELKIKQHSDTEHIKDIKSKSTYAPRTHRITLTNATVVSRHEAVNFAHAYILADTKSVKYTYELWIGPT